MAAPTFVKADAGATDAGGPWTSAGNDWGSPLGLGNIVVLQVVQDGTTTGAVTAGPSGSVLESLAGVENTLTAVAVNQPIGSPTSALQHIYVGRCRSVGQQFAFVSGDNTSTDDIYVRLYEFANVNTGTTLAAILENGTAGVVANGVGTGTTVSDTGVTTLGTDRLAVQFVGLNDDVAIDAFVGETGGNWLEAIAEYVTATGTDAGLQLQTATMATAGTINGGTDTIVTAGWGVIGFAFKPVVSGTAHAVPVNDTLALTDSLTSAKGKTVQIPDTVALADVFARTRTSSRTFADTVALIDSFTRTRVSLRTVTDALVLTDLASPVNAVGGIAHTRPIADTIALFDQFARVMAYGRTQADGLTLIDSTRDAQGIRLGDVVILVDQLARVATAVRTIADSLALTDSTTRTAGKTKVLADAVVLTDQLARAVAKARTLADTIALTDQFARATTKTRTVTDTIALADARRIAQGQALADAVALADQLTRIAPRIRTFADTVLLSDAVLTSKTGAGALNPADLIQIADSFTRIATYGRLLADTVVLTDARSLGRGKRVTDQVLLADLLARTTGKSRTVNDLIALTDHVITSKVTGGYVLNYATDIRWGEVQADVVLVGSEEVWTP